MFLLFVIILFSFLGFILVSVDPLWRELSALDYRWNLFKIIDLLNDLHKPFH